MDTLKLTIRIDDQRHAVSILKHRVVLITYKGRVVVTEQQDNHTTIHLTDLIEEIDNKLMTKIHLLDHSILVFVKIRINNDHRPFIRNIIKRAVAIKSEHIIDR